MLTQRWGGGGRWWETREQAGDSHPHFQSLKNCLKMGLSRPWGRISTCSGRKAWLTGCPPMLLRRGGQGCHDQGNTQLCLASCISQENVPLWLNLLVMALQLGCLATSETGEGILPRVSSTRRPTSSSGTQSLMPLTLWFSMPPPHTPFCGFF